MSFIVPFVLRQGLLIFTALSIGLWRFCSIGEMMTHVDDTAVMFIMISYGMLGGVINVINEMTYAPAQFVLSAPLIKYLGHNTEGIIFWSRASSAFMWTLGLVFFSVLAKNFFQGRRSFWSWPALLLVALSWRGWIESAQAYNYASTLVVACTCLAFLVFEWMFEALRGKRGVLFFVFSALLLGCLNFLSYQAFFMVAALYGSIGLGLVISKNFRNFFWIVLSYLIQLIPFAAVYFLSLRRFAGRGTPAWAGGVPDEGASLLQILTFFPTAWFEVLKSNFLLMPWGTEATFWATALVGTGLVAWILARSLPYESSEKRLGSFVIWLGIVWSVGSLLHLFPLSPSRHTFILQAPLVLLVVALLSRVSLRALSLQKTGAFVLSILIVILFGLHHRNFKELTKNQIDYGLIRTWFASAPAHSKAVSPAGAWTWDHLLFKKENPALSSKVAIGEWEWEATVKDKNLEELLIVSHRAPLSATHHALLKDAGYKEVTVLAEISATGEGTEPALRIERGNGFFAYRARK